MDYIGHTGDMMRGITLSILMIAGMLVFVGIAVGLDFSKYDESLSIGTDYDVQPIEVTFTIDDKVTVMRDSGAICDGDVVTFTNDETIRVYTVDGQKHMINWDGGWTSPDGEIGGISGSHFGVSTPITILDFIYHSKATGTMSITVSD